MTLKRYNINYHNLFYVARSCDTLFPVEKFSIKIARLLVRLGVSANFLTIAGLFLALGSGWLIFQGSFFLAGCVLLLSGFFDMLDGAVARNSGVQSKFGGILDSSLDRYGDGFAFGGILLFYANLYRPQYMALAISALLGSFLISYARARAECEMDDCRVGFWERGERLVFIALALFFHNLEAALWILGIGTHWTVLQRLFFARCQTKEFSAQSKVFWNSPSRSSAAYYLKIASLIFLLIFWRVSF